ncbi:MAG: N-6 DNA methylase [Candidatus Aenigmatarchaeota archaeon]
MNTQINDGYIIDFISGQKIKAKPEEIEAVQVFSKQLVEDYGYPKEYIQTRPQFRVKARPSDEKKEYPVDIAVFKGPKKNDEDLYIIVECKQKNRKDGRSQLQTYLSLSNASIGVWFNGNERLFLKKIVRNNKIDFVEIPNIPKFGQRLEDIGNFKRKDLKPTHNLKAIFKAIRNYLAANAVGVTRDEVLAQQLINIIFCKIYDEKFTNPEEEVNFRAGIDEDVDEVKKRVIGLFNKVKEKYKEVFDENDVITLDAKSIAYVVGELQNFCLIETERDVIADAFEIFIGHALKGEQGQFFTPRNLVRMMINILDPGKEDFIIDPACGSGGFLIEALRYVWKKIDMNGEELGWNTNYIIEDKIKFASNRIFGIEKDSFLAKVAKAYMAIIGDGSSGIFCEDSLEKPENWNSNTKVKIKLGEFSILFTNPPFGSKIPVSGEDKLKQYDLAHDWIFDEKEGKWKMGKLKDKESPQILFIERCLQLLKDGGKMAIILPDGIFGNESLAYIRNWLLKQGKIIALIDVPLETFMPNTSTKTTVLFFQKLSKIDQDYPVFMAVAETCGHDRRGKELQDDDITKIPDEFKLWQKDPYKYNSKENCFSVNLKDFIDYDLWLPKYLYPKFQKPLNDLKNKKIKTVKIGDIFDFKKGIEIGSKNYIDYLIKKDNDVPYIRTSDLVNYTLNRTCDLYIEEDLYKNLCNKYNFDLKEGDILFTKDGKIGMIAIVSKDTNFLISSGVVRCRIKEKSVDDIAKKYNVRINSKYVFALLLNREIGLYQALRRTVIAATIPHLSLSRLKDIEIPLFDQNTVDEITKMVDKIMSLENERNQMIDYLKKNFLKQFI